MYLESKRTIIRHFTIEDKEDLFEMLHDEETMQYLEEAYDEKQCEAFLWDFCVVAKKSICLCG